MRLYHAAVCPCGFATHCYKNHSVVRCTFYNLSVGIAFITTVVESIAPCYSFYNKASYRRHCGDSYRYYINVIASKPKRFQCIYSKFLRKLQIEILPFTRRNLRERTSIVYIRKIFVLRIHYRVCGKGKAVRSRRLRLVKGKISFCIFLINLL